MRIYSFLLVVLLALATPSYAQWSDFDIYTNSDQWGKKSEAFFKANKFKDYLTLTQGGITPTVTNDTTISYAKIKRYLDKNYPGVSSKGVLILDWESEVLKYIRDYPETHPRFKSAENQWMLLINEVRRLRPNIKIGLYGFPLRSFNDWQIKNYNKPGALDNILSKTDFICPTLYILYPDEQIGRARQLQYFRDNLDFALTYGKRLNKPVIPLFWHRVQASNKLYPRAIVQKEFFADYIKYISEYEFNDYKVSGLFLWEDGYVTNRLKDVKGVNNWLKNSVYNEPTYDAMCVELMKSVVQKLNSK